ncbi:uncharacterized protein LOC106655442 isoform X1 [Trichogramma pretiosum]|uniref:uncharacterized protein LOC106655442 isoform X1 n=1 Tax=Trichogramma pretiosum TaxID=7493 RepID=UPI0006C95814|nr:uncharacterized protein LOC106655442 isoform X1 [Trichogramma pretiosum]
MPTDSAKLYSMRAEELQAEFRDLSKALEASHENQRMLYQAIAENRNERRMLFENRVSLADGGTPPLLRELKRERLGGATTLTVVDSQQQQQQQTSAATSSTTTMTRVAPGGGGGLIVKSASGAQHTIRHSAPLPTTTLTTAGGVTTVANAAGGGASYRLQQINPQQIRSKVVYLSNNGQEIVKADSSPAAQKNIIYNIKRKADDGLEVGNPIFSLDSKQQMNPVYITKLPATKTLKLCPIEIGSKDYRIVSETNALPAITQKPKVVQTVAKVVKQTPPVVATTPQFSKVVTRTVAKIDRRKLKQAATSSSPANATTTTTTTATLPTNKVFVKMEYDDDLDMDIVEEPIPAPTKPTTKSSTEKSTSEEEPKDAATAAAATDTAKEGKSDTNTNTNTKTSKKAAAAAAAAEAAAAEPEKAEKSKAPEKKIGIWRKRCTRRT